MHDWKGDRRHREVTHAAGGSQVVARHGMHRGRVRAGDEQEEVVVAYRATHELHLVQGADVRDEVVQPAWIDIELVVGPDRAAGDRAIDDQGDAYRLAGLQPLDALTHRRRRNAERLGHIAVAQAAVPLEMGDDPRVGGIEAGHSPSAAAFGRYLRTSITGSTRTFPTPAIMPISLARRSRSARSRAETTDSRSCAASTRTTLTTCSTAPIR